MLDKFRDFSKTLANQTKHKHRAHTFKELLNLTHKYSTSNIKDIVNSHTNNNQVCRRILSKNTHQVMSIITEAKKLVESFSLHKFNRRATD